MGLSNTGGDAGRGAKGGGCLHLWRLVIFPSFASCAVTKALMRLMRRSRLSSSCKKRAKNTGP